MSNKKTIKNAKKKARNDRKKDRVKVSCAICEAQYNRFCTTKRVTVALNKKRLCDKFIYDENKVKNGVPIPTTRITFNNKEALRKEHKKELKELRDKLKEGIEVKPENTVPRTTSEKHPLTGDLSRFTTTGSKDEDK